MGKLSRTKGHSFEREIAKQLRDEGIFPDAKRKLEYQIDECVGVDLENTGSLQIQLKRYKKYVNPSVIEEIIKQDKKIPLLVTKADKKEAIACLYWSDFLKIIKFLVETKAPYEK